MSNTDNCLLNQLRSQRLKAYEAAPGDLQEHFGIEQTVLAGGYGYRQILELVQNSADAILEANDATPDSSEIRERIDVLLRGTHLYVANTGAALSRDGVEALLRSHSSPKRGNQIGRFGLGFKSLLSLEGKIDIFSKAFSLRFDPHRCREELKERFNVPDAPALRLAWPLDSTAEAKEDAMLASLDWATTIVRAEVGSSAVLEHLRNEIAEFPIEFLLFLPIRIKLRLDDDSGNSRNLIRVPSGPEVSLNDGETVSNWRVVEKTISIADLGAKRDATHIHARDTVPMAWAIPLDSKREEAGRFWAFFPTLTQTRLAGILNAPWKLNSDRNALIPGEWNSTLMSEAAKLVAENIWSLSTVDDPGRPLDAFPRQIEHKDEEAAPLVEALWASLEDAAVLPDAAGCPKSARELLRHPRDNAELARKWQVLAGPADLALMVHPSCLERQRASRLKALAARLNPPGHNRQSSPNLCEREPHLWFAAVASIEARQAVQVLQLAEAYKDDCKPTEWGPLRPRLSIVPSQAGTLVGPDKIVFAPTGVSVPNREAVASVLCDDTDARRILTGVLQVQALDDNLWESVLLESLNPLVYRSAATDSGWNAFWDRLRQAPGPVGEQFASQHAGKIRIRRHDSSWALATEVLLPGSLVDANDVTSNQGVLIDKATHSADAKILVALGARDFPQGTIGPGRYTKVISDRAMLQEWLYDWRSVYKRTLQNAASRPYLEPLSLTMPSGWHFLDKLYGASNARLANRFLSRIRNGEFVDNLEFGHVTMPSYSKIDVPHPLPWLLFKHGTCLIGAETVRLVAVAARSNEPALRRIDNWQQLHQTLERLMQADPSYSVTKIEIRAMWLALMKAYALPSDLENDALQDLWAAAAKDAVAPDMIRTENGDVSLSDLFVTGSADLARRARRPGRVVITLDEIALELWAKGGARKLADLARSEWESATAPVDILTSAIPELAEVLRVEARESARCQPVLKLKLTIDELSEPVPCMMWDQVLLLDDAQLAQVSRSVRLKLLIDEAAAAGWLDCPQGEALRRLGDGQVDNLRAEVARATPLAGRLLQSVGGRREPLLDVLGDFKSMEFVQRCTPLQLAGLVLAQFGPTALSELKDVLRAEGLKPPDRWGTSEARTFVASIGFPEEFAATPDTRRVPEERIGGPIELPSLHSFQREVLEGVRELIGSGSSRRRAVVSLPTGGGKTRVTVEAAVRLVLAPESDHRSVIWIAQTDELCEQAVQAFRQVWLNLGAQRTDLRIVRLWGGNPSPTIQGLDRPIAIVASIQTLNNRMGTEGLDWLKKPGLVVVDECHHAITPSYTNLLRWLDAEAQRPGAPAKYEPPIVGLSATPFRTDDEESLRLARRFNNRWLPQDQEGLHKRLRAEGVLAAPEYESLHSEASLLDEEINALSELDDAWEGLDFENLLEKINQRLAGDSRRNQKLVEYIQQCSERSILFFTNSVRHAEEMSARLNLAGIPSAAVSGSTTAAARRYFLDRFQRGDIRIICNHSVLTTGFDAPKTDMVLIARQVFSPVRYMQMVGRGLRGEKNGGTAHCRIVTVLDNLGRFSNKHPYHFCAKYFGSGQPRP